MDYSIFNWVIALFGNHVRALGKMFSNSTYDMEMSQYDFDYHVRSLRDSFEGHRTKKGMK